MHTQGRHTLSRQQAGNSRQCRHAGNLKKNWISEQAGRRLCLCWQARQGLRFEGLHCEFRF